MNKIDDKDLEKVTGGAYAGYTSKDQITFKLPLGYRVEIPTDFIVLKQCTVGSTVQKLGYTYIPELGYYEPCYYLVAIKDGEHNWDAWYGECTVCGGKQTTWRNAKVKGQVVEI